MPDTDPNSASPWPDFYRLCGEHLLPIHAVEVELKLLEPLRLGFYHHGPLRAWINNLLDDDKQNLFFWIHALASGRIHFERGEIYRFQLWCAPGGEAHLDHILKALRKLPVVGANPDLPFNGCFSLYRLVNPFTLQPIQTLNQLVPYTKDTWQREITEWETQSETITQRLLTPARILLPSELHQEAKGDKRYIRDRCALPGSGLFEGIANTLAELLRTGGVEGKRPSLPSANFRSLVSWVEDYYGGKPPGQRKPIGGVGGRHTLPTR